MPAAAFSAFTVIRDSGRRSSSASSRRRRFRAPPSRRSTGRDRRGWGSDERVVLDGSRQALRARRQLRGFPAEGVLDETGGPGAGEPLHEGPALVGPTVVVFGGRHIREDRDQVRRSADGSEHLRGADVGAAVHADLAVGAGELGRPFHRVVAVLAFIPKGVELAAGVEATTRILHDHEVAVRGELAGLGLAGLPVVWGAGEQHRVVAGGLGPV